MSREHQIVSMHGEAHQPGGADPARPERWHIVGDTGEPAFQNGWSNIGGTYGDTKFRLVVGKSGWETQTLEIMLAVSGGGAGTTIFTLPSGYYEFAKGKNFPCHGHDSSGNYRAYHIDGTTGDVVDGV